MNFIGAVLFFLVLITGIIMLQVQLSKKKSKWPGLVLPLLSFSIAVIIVFSITVYTTTSTMSIQRADESRAVIQEKIIAVPEEDPISNTVSLIFTIIKVLVLYNIGTVILVMIYFNHRKKMKQREIFDI